MKSKIAPAVTPAKRDNQDEAMGLGRRGRQGQRPPHGLPWVTATQPEEGSPPSGLNRRPRPYQGRALPTELGGQLRAGDRTRTGDVQLGRLTLYQLSYTRDATRASAPCGALDRGWRVVDSNHRRRCRQIYSLLPLATRATLRNREANGNKVAANRLRAMRMRELMRGLEPLTPCLQGRCSTS
jgi:hypothetical protein